MQVLYEHYQKLHTVLTLLDKKSERYQLLETYVEQSQEKGSRIKLLDVLEVEREGEAEQFVPRRDDANRQLLWHGSRLTNYVGILSTGLRIAPPSGYRFGKGIYFADCMSKWSQYTTVNKRRHGVMLLCEVALGKQRRRRCTTTPTQRSCTNSSRSFTSLGCLSCSGGTSRGSGCARRRAPSLRRTRSPTSLTLRTPSFKLIVLSFCFDWSVSIDLDNPNLIIP